MTDRTRQERIEAGEIEPTLRDVLDQIIECRRLIEEARRPEKFGE